MKYLNKYTFSNWVLNSVYTAADPAVRLTHTCVKCSTAVKLVVYVWLHPAGLDKIEFLQSHENQEIYQKAFDLIEHYFGVEEEDPSLAPQVDQSQGQFVFQQQEGPMEGFQL